MKWTHSARTNEGNRDKTRGKSAVVEWVYTWLHFGLVQRESQRAGVKVVQIGNFHLRTFRLHQFVFDPYISKKGFSFYTIQQKESYREAKQATSCYFFSFTFSQWWAEQENKVNVKKGRDRKKPSHWHDHDKQSESRENETDERAQRLQKKAIIGTRINVQIQFYSLYLVILTWAWCWANNFWLLFPTLAFVTIQRTFYKNKRLSLSDPSWFR